jgi:hypothetical protein
MKTMVNNSRTYVDDLIPGQTYFVIQEWNMDNSRRRYPLLFQGEFIRYYHWNHTSRVEFLENGSIRTISSCNEFYRVIPMFTPSMNESIIQRARLITNPKLSFEQLRDIEYNPMIVMKHPEYYFTDTTLDQFFLGGTPSYIHDTINEMV